MLEQLDEVLLEQYIISRNMNKMERDICMLYISNIKDIVDSDIETENRKFNISTLRLDKSDGIIYFSGEVFNECETRDIVGTLTKNGKNICVDCKFLRLVENLPMEEAAYSTIDLFKSSNNGFISRRSSYYKSGKKFKDLVALNINDLNNLYLKRIGKAPILTK